MPGLRPNPKAADTSSTASGQSRGPQPPLATTGLGATSGLLSAPGCRRARHATPTDRRMRSKQSAARCESRTHSSRVPGRTGTRSLSRRRSLYLKSSRPGGVIGDGTRRRSMSTNRSPRSSAMSLLNPRADHSVRSGANLVSRRGTGTLPTRPDPFACRNLASTSRLTRSIRGSTSIEAGGLCGLIERPCEAFQHGRAANSGRCYWFLPQMDADARGWIEQYNAKAAAGTMLKRPGRVGVPRSLAFRTSAYFAWLMQVFCSTQPQRPCLIADLQ